MTETHKPKPLEQVTLGDLMQGEECLAMDLWGSDLERAQEALEDYHTDCEDLGGMPIGELHRYSNDKPGKMESLLIVRTDDGTIRIGE